MSNLGTMLPMLYHDGVSAGRISMNKLVRIFFANPARLFGLFPQKGTIAPGSDADIVIFDPEKNVTIQHRDMHSRQDWERSKAWGKGMAAMTLSRGEMVVENGKVLEQAERGRLLKHR